MCMFKHEKGKTKRIKIIVEQDHGRRVAVMYEIWIIAFCTRSTPRHCLTLILCVFVDTFLRGCADIIMMAMQTYVSQIYVMNHQSVWRK